MDGSNEFRCPVCHGTGDVFEWPKGMFQRCIPTFAECKLCKGTGRMPTVLPVCPCCEGKGWYLPVEEGACFNFMHSDQPQKCRSCKGKGYISKQSEPSVLHRLAKLVKEFAISQ